MSKLIYGLNSASGCYRIPTVRKTQKAMRRGNIQTGEDHGDQWEISLVSV